MNRSKFEPSRVELRAAFPDRNIQEVWLWFASYDTCTWPMRNTSLTTRPASKEHRHPRSLITSNRNGLVAYCLAVDELRYIDTCLHIDHCNIIPCDLHCAWMDKIYLHLRPNTFQNIALNNRWMHLFIICGVKARDVCFLLFYFSYYIDFLFNSSPLLPLSRNSILCILFYNSKFTYFHLLSCFYGRMSARKISEWEAIR